MAQLRQSLAAPPWVPEDWEWRPTVIPDIARLPHSAAVGPVSAADLAAEGDCTIDPTSGGSQEQHRGTASNSPTSGAQPALVATLASLLSAQAELESPRRAVAAIQDQGRYEAYRRAITTALEDRPGVGGECSGP